MKPSAPAPAPRSRPARRCPTAPMPWSWSRKRRRQAPRPVDILAAATPGQNIGRRGADIRPGDLVVRRGDLLSPSRVGALAAIGCANVEVYARPRVAVLSTGQRSDRPGDGAGSRPDLRREPVHACRRHRRERWRSRSRVRPSPDTLEALTAALDACAGADVIVFSGGSSVGERDLIVDVIAARGELILHGIAVKPGKPTAFAMVGGTPFFGMPGNPTSCLSNAYILFAPFLRATARLPRYRPHTVQAPLGTRIVSPAGRHQFYTVRLRDGAHIRPSRGRARSRACRRPTGTSRFPPTKARSRREPSWRSRFSDTRNARC